MAPRPATVQAKIERSRRQEGNVGEPIDTGIVAAAASAKLAAAEAGAVTKSVKNGADFPDRKNVGQTKESEINPVSALMVLRDKGANIKTLLAAMNENFAVVRYGSEILVANIIGDDIKCMNEQNFHRMFANLVIFQNPIEVALRKMKERIAHIGNDIISMTVEDFQEKFDDLVIVDKNPIKVSRYWFNSEKRRQYLGRGVVFEPGGPLEIPKRYA